MQQYFTNTVLYQPYLYAQMRGVSLETMLSQAGYSSVDEYLESSESSKQSMIKQILIMQALAEKNNIVCDTDILNAEFSRYFGSTDMTRSTTLPKLPKLFASPLILTVPPAPA